MAESSLPSRPTQDYEMPGRTAITQPESGQRRRRRSALGRVPEGAVVAALSIGSVALTLTHRLSADEGQVLTGAWNLFNGSRVYEDFFEFIGPASFAWIDLFFRAFGASYTAALVGSQVLLVVSIWTFYEGSRLVGRQRAPAVAVSLLWVLVATIPPFVNHNTYSTYLATAVALCVLRALITGSAATALGGGALASLTFFFLQPKGAALILVGLAALVWLVDHERRNEQRPFTLPLSFALGAALVGAGGIAIWGLDPFTTLLTVADGNVAMNHLNLSYAPLALAVGLAALIGVACYRDRLFDRVTALLLLLQAGLWGSVLHLPDLWHLTINAFPLLMLTGRLAAAGSRERPRPRGWRLAMGGLLALVVGIGIVRAVSRNVSDARLAREWIDLLGGIIDGEEFFAFTFLPSFYLELETFNPYYNSVLYTASHPEAHFERNVDILTRRQPRFVLADYSSVEKYGHTLDNPVDRLIRNRYRRVHELAHTMGVMEVWELRADGQSSPAETNRPNRRENP